MDTLNFFISENELPTQDGTKSYGVISSTQYRVTSIFNGSVSGNDPMAYAVTKGMVFIVEQTGNPDRVNLFLKPEQLPYGVPVKYFVYRGLLKSDFLDKSNSYSVIKPTSTDDSDLIKKIRKGQDGINALNLYSDLDDTDYIDNLFIKDEYQFALVDQGDSLGRFDTIASTLDYGFEIMLDEFWYRPTFAIARTDSNIINIPSTPYDDDVARLDALAYIDPAAYFGYFSHKSFSIGTNNNATPNSRTKKDVYELVKKFATKNTVYLDIRDKDWHPVDWYEDSPQTVKLSTDGTSALTATEESYRDTNLFPVKIISESFSNSQTNNDQQYFTFGLSLSTVNNSTPLLALHLGYWLSAFPDYNNNLNYSKCTDNSGWTDDKNVVVFAADDSGTVPVATYIRVQLLEYEDADALDNQILDGDTYEPFVVDVKYLFPVYVDMLPTYSEITIANTPVIQPQLA